MINYLETVGENEQRDRVTFPAQTVGRLHHVTFADERTMSGQ